MRVLIDGRVIQDHFPGIARYTYSLLTAMLSLPAAPDIVLLYDPDARNTRYPLAKIACDPQATLLAAKAPLFSKEEQWRLPRQIATARPDLVHFSYYIHPYWVKAPAICTIYDLIPLRFPQLFSAKQRFLFRLTTKLAAYRSDHLIGTSQATGQDMHRLFQVPLARLSVVPGATAPDFYPRSESERREIRQKHSLPARYLLYLGSNKPHKNLVRLIEAWGHIAASYPQAILVIAGHWDQRFPESLRQAEKCGISERTRFLGPVAEADLPALYSAALAFLFPSLYEGFGLPVLEAMACGTPVLTSSQGSLGEVAGDAALTIDPYDTAVIAEGVATLIEDAPRREKLIQRGKRRAEQFSWEESARRTLAVYRRVLAAS